jgi:hypothetical protein
MIPDRKCSNCARVIPLDSKLCPYCGVEFTEETINVERKKVEEYNKKIRKKENRKSHIVIIILIVFTILIAWVVWQYVPKLPPRPCEIPITIRIKDFENGTIWVVSAPTNKTSGGSLDWENVRIVNGDIDLPTGRIELGEEIKNCKGRVTLEWIPCNRIFFDEEFE